MGAGVEVEQVLRQKKLGNALPERGKQGRASAGYGQGCNRLGHFCMEIFDINIKQNFPNFPDRKKLISFKIDFSRPYYEDYL